MSFMLVLGLTVGSLGLLMLQHLVSGHWGIIIRRSLESATRTLPLMVLAFLPIVLFGMHHLYAGHGDEKGWLNAPPTGEGALSTFRKAISPLMAFLAFTAGQSFISAFGYC